MTWVTGLTSPVKLAGLVLLSSRLPMPHKVKEALLPGLYSILDVTPLELCRVMADALDANGRALWKDIYNNYGKFGRWKGV